MKFDSYARFVKSPLYRECLLAEAEGRALPEPGSSRLGSPEATRKVRTRVCGRQRAQCRSAAVAQGLCAGEGPAPCSIFPVPAEVEAEAREVAAAGRGGAGAAAAC